MEFTLSEIQSIRKHLGITQSRLAMLSGVSQSLIAKIEAGKIDPTYSNAEKILSTLKKLTRKEEKKIKDLINNKLITVEMESTIEETTQKMKKHGISQVPVLDKSRHPVGLITENSLLDALINGNPKTTLIKEIMLECPPILNSDANMNAAFSLLRYYPIILVNEKNKLKGILTKSDVITSIYK
ncbi:MAG: CBS domain-containing protein [Candidatus Woesearchaeota archaeon]